MYPMLLILHSWLRWIVILVGLWTLVRLRRGGSEPLARERAGRAVLAFMIAIDVQVLIGTLLFVWFSPLGFAALGRMTATMTNAQARFWIVEHPSMMVLAAALGHVARALVRRGPWRLVRWLAIAAAGLAVVALLAGIPWPFRSPGRPLLRF